MGRTIKTKSSYVFSTLPRLGQSEKVLRAQSMCKLYRTKTHNSQQCSDKDLRKSALFILFAFSIYIGFIISKKSFSILLDFM